jgi:hypothetical protein
MQSKLSYWQLGLRKLIEVSDLFVFLSHKMGLMDHNHYTSKDKST